MDNRRLQVDQLIKEQMLDQVPSSIMAVDKDFRIIYMNNAGLKTLGKSADDLIGHYCRDAIGSSHCNTDSCCMKKAIETGETHSDRTEVPVNGGKITVEYYAVPLKDSNDNTIGGLEFAVNITKRVEYERNLIEQSRTIQQLSTPTIRLWDGILVLPIVGVIDSLRAQNMMESMLNKIVETIFQGDYPGHPGSCRGRHRRGAAPDKNRESDQAHGMCLHSFRDIACRRPDNYSARDRYGVRQDKGDPQRCFFGSS